MNGPEHYTEAERLAGAYKDAITSAEQLPDETPRQAELRYLAVSSAQSLLSKAQVHASLALVAAIAERRSPGVDGSESLLDMDDWERALGRSWDQ